jgi:hypothetical protein
MAARLPQDDTSPEARDFLRRRYAAMSLAEKAECLRAVTLAANEMALAGIRLRHPDASRAQLLLELARLRLGDDVVQRVYGAARRT